MSAAETTGPGSHLVHHMSSLAAVADQGAFVVVKGDGARVTTADGTEYLDGVAGLININVGHGREELVEAASAAMRDLAYGTLFFGMATTHALGLADDLARITPAGMERFFFAVGGSDANDSAIKIARRYQSLRGHDDRAMILARHDSYHGMTVAGMSATGDTVYRTHFGPVIPGFVHVGQPSGDTAADVAALEATIAEVGAERIAAMIAEPLSLPSGLVIPPDDYWPAVHAVLEQHGILLIADEVVTGFGRTGRMFGMEHWGITPDLMSMSKGITSGYLPLAAVGMTDRVYATLEGADGAFLHGFTTGGHPTSCALARANLGIIEREDLVGNAERRGAHFQRRLDELCAAYPAALRGRHLGLLVALDLERPAGFELPDGVASFGLYVRNELFATQRQIIRYYRDTLVWGPSLAITEAEIDELVDGVAAVLDAVTSAP